MDKITSGSNVYFENYSRGHVIDFKESVDGGLTSVNTSLDNTGTVKTLLTNGKFQGNDTGESAAQGGFAIAPLMHLKNSDSALVIGDFNVTVSETAQGTALVFEGGVFTAVVQEAATIADTVISRYLWELINTQQNPNWQGINTQQTPAWQDINTQQNPNWQEITTT